MKELININEYDLKKIISEEIERFRDLLSEGMSSILYHFTSLKKGYSICQQNTIFLQSAYSKDADNYDKKRKYYLSCTRMPSSQFGYSYKFSNGGVRIVLDGDKLSQTLKGKPVNYWGGGVFMDKYYYYKNDTNFDTAQHHTANESEDRIFSYSPTLENANRYIISVDVLMPDLNENEESKQLAYAFTTSSLGMKVKIFDSVKEFNSPNGKNVNDNIEYQDKISQQRDLYNNSNKINHILNAVVSFIAFENPEFEGKNFGASVSNLLRKYDLSEFTGQIGEIQNNLKRTYGINQCIERVDSVRRELSDEPSRVKSKILKMLTDYLLEIGADNFWEGMKLKKSLINAKYDKTADGFRRNDDVDWEKQIPLTVVNDSIVVPDPSRTLFKDAVDMNDEDLRCVADSIASDIMYDKTYDGKYQNIKSKNQTSLFQYIYKLFRKGSIKHVKDAFESMGLSDDYLNGFNIKIETRNLGFYDLYNYDTVTTAGIKRSDWNYNYRKLSYMKDNELAPLYSKTQDNVQNQKAV